jgi:hypothetical protein
VALDPAGDPRIGFDLKHWQSRGGPADADVHWSRFASFRQL